MNWGFFRGLLIRGSLVQVQEGEQITDNEAITRVIASCFGIFLEHPSSGPLHPNPHFQTVKSIRNFIRVVGVFGQNHSASLSWGTNEKLYRAFGNTLEVVTFDNTPIEGNYFSNKKSFEFQAWKGKILKGGTSYFGTIIECEYALVVLMGENEFINIPGSPTRWRTYPRSLNYENHLHVIKDDRLEIYSFHNDYFRSQEKDFGIRFILDKPKFDG